MSLHQARGVERGQEPSPGFSCCFSMGTQRGTAKGCSHGTPKSPSKAFFLLFLLRSRALNPVEQRDVARPWPQRCAGPILRPPRAINGKKNPKKPTPSFLTPATTAGQAPHRAPPEASRPPQEAPVPVGGAETDMSHPHTPTGSKTRNSRQTSSPEPPWVLPGSAAPRRGWLPAQSGAERGKFKSLNAKFKTNAFKGRLGQSPSLH